MVIFRSLQPPIDLPTTITTFDWLFDSPASPLSYLPDNRLAGFQNAVTKERLNWRQVRDYATYISTALVKRYGMREGDTVSLFSQNSIWYPVAMQGAVRAGGKVSGASPAYNVEEMTYALKVGQGKFLFTMPESMEVGAAAARAAGIPKENLFLLEGSMDGYTTIKELIEIGKGFGEGGQVPAYKIPEGKKNKDVCGFLSFSSGTTGLPKAVMIAHQNVIAQCLQVQQITPKSHKKVLAVLPLFHITGLVHGLHLPILLNAEVIMCPTFSMPLMLQTIVDHQIQELLLVPPLIIRLVRDPIVNNYDLRHVRRFSSGAAPMSDEVIQLLRKKFPNTGFKQGYGMTESCSCITAHPPEFYDYRYAHAGGTVVASTEVKIVTAEGKEAGVGEAGEILARGPQVVMGYLDNEKATRETFDAEGWLHTGDQGRIDEEGVLHILDRIKEMIKVKGIGVAPAELEDLLLGHPSVEDVAVMGVQDEYSGELPKAFVVLKSGVEVNEKAGKDLLAYVREKKTRYKWVKEIEFTDEIPKSASGKILRRMLRDKEKAGRKGVLVRDTFGERANL